MKVTYHRDGTVSLKGMNKYQFALLLSHATCDTIRSSIKAREDGNSALEVSYLESYDTYRGIQTFLDGASRGESETFNM